jgi:mitochondrial fission protein ELM1
VAEENDVLLAITTSRRTPPKVATRLKKRFGQNHFVWTGDGENPYFASLAMASHIIVTGDSVSMITEASATGKPVLVEHLTERRPAQRFRRFHRMFADAGITREFEGELTDWTYEPPRDTEKVAAIIRERMNQK